RAVEARPDFPEQIRRRVPLPGRASYPATDGSRPPQSWSRSPGGTGAAQPFVLTAGCGTRFLLPNSLAQQRSVGDPSGAHRRSGFVTRLSRTRAAPLLLRLLDSQFHRGRGGAVGGGVVFPGDRRGGLRLDGELWLEGVLEGLRRARLD